MKKIIATFVAGLMMFSLAACGADSPASEKETSASVTVSQGTVQQESDIQGTSSGATLIEDNSESESTESKALVVYFSWSGNTESVANEIQSQTKAEYRISHGRRNSNALFQTYRYSHRQYLSAESTILY